MSTSGKKSPDDFFVIGTADLNTTTQHADIRFEILNGVKNAADFLIDFIFNQPKNHQGEWHVFFRGHTEAQAVEYRQKMRDWYDNLEAQRASLPPSTTRNRRRVAEGGNSGRGVHGHWFSRGACAVDIRTTDVSCSHCGLPVPPGLIQPDEELQFCCRGCRTVYQVIHGCGLERFYRLRDASDGNTRPARTTNRAYSEFDDEAFRKLYYQDLADGSQAVEFYLEGVHCAACVWLVEKLPQVRPGVIESRLDMRRAIVEVRWDPKRTKLSQIAGTLDSLGYPPHPAKDIRARQVRRDENRRFLIRIGVAAACVGNVMTLAFALYGGVFTGIEEQYKYLFRWATMLFGVIALIWPGSLFFRGAWAALRTKTAHLDLPIAIGLAAGGVAGTVNAVLGRGEIYFDSLTMLVLLLLIGRWLQRRQQSWANDSLELLFSLTPTTSRRLENAAVVEVPIEAVHPGDLLEVRAGDSIPADGNVLEGESSVNRALLTGESQPVTVRPGSAVHAGTVNLSSRLVVRVEAVGVATRVGRLMQLVEQHSRNRPPIVQFADRIAGRFVRIVLAVAATTFLAWVWISPTKAVDNAVALLIVTCPCAWDWPRRWP